MTDNEIPTRMASVFKEFREFADESARAMLEHLSVFAEDFCQSEIEKSFFLAYAFRQKRGVLFGSEQGGAARFCINIPGHKQEAIEQWEDDSVREVNEISAQSPIGKYKADFVVTRTIKWEGQFYSSPLVVVECDGHDYHERTKEQATHDKSRDRFMTLEGYSILRFTGSEIYRNPAKCAGEVHEYLEEAIAKVVRSSRRRHEPITDPFAIEPSPFTPEQQDAIEEASRSIRAPI